VFLSLLYLIGHLHDTHQYQYAQQFLVGTQASLTCTCLACFETIIFFPWGRPSWDYFQVFKPSHINIPYVNIDQFSFHEVRTRFAKFLSWPLQLVTRWGPHKPGLNMIMTYDHFLKKYDGCS